MKKLLLLASLAIAFTYQGLATHAAGGSIWYEYIGDSTNTPYHYMIHLEIVRRNETGTASLPSSQNISVNSSCFGTQTLNLQRLTPPMHLDAGDGGFLPTPNTNCSNALYNDPNRMNVSIHRYSGAVVLGGKCSDFLISYDLCCMNSNITNLLNPSSQSLYFDARLNNTLGPNTSPRFLVSPDLAYCVNQQANTYHTAVEPNGDSLFYALANPQSSATQHITFAPGFSAKQPISTTNGVFLDSLYGLMSFIPTTVENDVVKIKVREFRKDTVLNTYNLVGVSSRQVQYQITASCDTARLSWSLRKDSLGLNTSIDPQCQDSVVKFSTSFAFLKSSLSADGTDFTLIDVDAGNVVIPIVKASTNNDGPSQFADEVRLHLNQPIYHDGNYKIVTRTGLDGNTIINICGKQIPANDTVGFIVSDCQTGFGLKENHAHTLALYPSPATHSLQVILPREGGTYSYGGYNLQGQRAFEGTLTSRPGAHHTLPLPGVKAGLYLLKLKAPSGKIYSGKFVKL